MDNITTTGDNGRSHEVAPDAVLVFLDETGHEEFADSNYPVFGLGGCVVKVQEYRTLVHEPWRALRRKHLGSADASLHASDLGQLRNVVAPEIGEIFHKNRFGRIAVVATASSAIPPDMPGPWLLAGAVMHRVGRLIAALQVRPSQVWIALEDSERLGHRLAFHLSRYRLEGLAGDYSCRPEIRLMHKKSAEPGLEVADFIMHAAGGSAQKRSELARDPRRKDFHAVFRPRDVPGPLVEYKEITQVAQT